MGNKHQLPDVFYPEHLVRLIDVIDRPKVGMAVCLAFFCGLRISEVCNLKIEHVDLHAKRIKIVDSKYTLRKKTGYGKDRYVPLPDQLISPLGKWIKLMQGGKWVFPSDKSPNSPLRKKSLHEQFREFLKRADLCVPKYQYQYKTRVNGKKVERTCTRHKYYFHTLRHSYATYLRNKGVEIDVIKELLGHERYDTTLIYAKIAHVNKVQAVNQAFDVAQRNQYIEPAEVKRLAIPERGQSPLDFLQIQMLRGEISKEEYSEKLKLFNGESMQRIK